MSSTSIIPCSQCGYESPENAKFCRSCGAPLLAESESSAAGTRPYGRQEAIPQRASAPLPSQPLNASVVDTFGDETRRQPAYVPPSVSNTNPFATPPVPQPYGYAPPVPQYNYAPPAPAKRHRWGKWGVGLFLVTAAFGLGTTVNRNNNNARLSPVEFRVLEDARREGRLNDRMASSFADARSRAEREINERIKKIERAGEDARRAAERGTQTDLLGIPLLSLDKYEYQQATVSNAIRIPGKELTTQHVKTDFAALVRHYEALLGKPVIFENAEDDDEKRALFQSPGSPDQPSVSVFIKESDDYNGQWEVMIVRSPFSFPRLTDGKPVAPSVDAAAPPDIKGVVAPPALAEAPKLPAKANRE